MKKKRYNPEKLGEREINYHGHKLKIGIYRTTFFYDILIIGDEKAIRKLRKENDLDGIVLVDSIFNECAIVYDTADTIGDAKNLFDNLELK
jgi:hypothetical protein